MRFMKRLLRLGMAMLLSFTAATALAAETATVTVNVTNTPVCGDVLLEKTGLQLVRFEDEQDAYGNTVMRPVFQNGYLAGAVFELRAAEDIVGKEGTVFYHEDELIETLTTSKTGSVKSKVLPLGKYTLTEISAPDGYAFDSTPHPFTLAAVDKQTAIVEAKVSAANTFLPIRVTLRKQKENLLLTQTQEGMIHQTVEVYPGEGFVFGLFNSDVITYGDAQKLPANTLIATGTTDAKGNLTFSGLYPHGNYYIRELSVPDGWLLSTEQYPITLTSANKAVSENVITVYLENPILNRLIYTPVTITKTDITGAKKLPGALIEVYDSDGNTIYREYTNEKGEIPNIPVVPGTYTFKETYSNSLPRKEFRTLINRLTDQPYSKHRTFIRVAGAADRAAPRRYPRYPSDLRSLSTALQPARSQRSHAEIMRLLLQPSTDWRGSSCGVRRSTSGGTGGTMTR